MLKKEYNKSIDEKRDIIDNHFENLIKSIEYEK